MLVVTGPIPHRHQRQVDLNIESDQVMPLSYLICARTRTHATHSVHPFRRQASLTESVCQSSVSFPNFKQEASYLSIRPFHFPFFL